MKMDSTHREILFVTAKNVSQEFCETIEEHNYNRLTETEKLEIACRNSLVPVMLPEIFEQDSAHKKLHLWKMRDGALFIELKLGEVYFISEMRFSIDPYAVSAMQILS